MYWHYWYSESCPLFGGVLYSERPLLEVPLYMYFKPCTVYNKHSLQHCIPAKLSDGCGQRVGEDGV